MTKSKSIGSTAKQITKIVVLILCILLLARVFFAFNSSMLSDLAATDKVKELYKSGELYIQTNKIVDEISEDGYFSAYAFYYVPEAAEVQVTVRFNNSTLSRLGLDSDDIDFCLLNYETGEYYNDTDEYTKSGQRMFYNYRKLVFDSVTIADEGTNLLLVLRTPDSDVDVNTLVIHFAERQLEDYNLSRSDKKALEG